MKVYIVMQEFTEFVHADKNILSVHANRSSAERTAAAERAAIDNYSGDQEAVDIRVEEHDVIGGEATSTRKPPPKPNPSRPIIRGG